MDINELRKLTAEAKARQAEVPETVRERMKEAAWRGQSTLVCMAPLTNQAVEKLRAEGFSVRWREDRYNSGEWLISWE